MGGITSSISSGKVVSSERSKLDLSKLSAQSSRSLRAVDRFLQLVLSNMSTNDSIRALVENPIALETFCHFLALKLLESKDEWSDIISQENILFTKLSNLMMRVKNVLKIEYLGLSEPSVIEQINPRLIKFARQVFPLYLHSEYFDQWRTRETWKTILASETELIVQSTLPELGASEGDAMLFKQAVATAPPKGIISTVSSLCDHFNGNNHNNNNNVIPTAKTITIMEENNIICSSNVPYNEESSVIHSAVNSCDPLEILKIIKSDGWLTILIAASETLPIGISLSTVSRDVSGYPVIYVNRHFEAHTGYSRKEIIGEKFGFMQKAGTQIAPDDMVKIDKLSIGLAQAEPTVVALNCRRRNGLPFITVVGIKPVIDKTFTYRYVIGVQVEVNISESLDAALFLMKTLIGVLPCAIQN
eukprot:gene7336-14974_t